MWGKKKKVSEGVQMAPATYAEALLQAKANANKHANENLALKTEINKLNQEIRSMKSKLDNIKKKLEEVISE